VSTATLIGEFAKRVYTTSTSLYDVRFTQNEKEVRAAQRLRYETFIAEPEIRSLSNIERIDEDYFDRYCAHLIAIDRVHGDVVGTYRVLYPEARYRAGRYYMEELFHTAALFRVHNSTAEIGRACIHPQARNSVILMRMWGVLAKALISKGVRFVIGSSSIPVAGRPGSVMRLYNEVSHNRKCPLSIRVEPRIPAASIASVASLSNPLLPMPSLLRGYLEMGAHILGEPAYDEEFDCIDIPLVFDLDSAKSRLAQRALKVA
jgi:putative hemolysin